MLASQPRPSVSIPRPPESEPLRRVPIIATIAPVIASVVLFAFTRSVFTLGFALLGPVVAVASIADSAVVRRRSRTREVTRFAGELDQANELVDAAHRAELAGLDARYPGAHTLVDAPEHVSLAWRNAATGEPEGSLVARIGSAELPAALVLQGSVSPGRDRKPDPALASLVSRAQILSGAPITADLGGGIGLAGPAIQTTAIARGVLLQLAARLSPSTSEITAPPESEWDWLESLPHSIARTGTSDRVDLVGEGVSTCVAIATGVGALPSDLRTLVRVGADGLARRAANSPGEVEQALRPEFVGRQTAAKAAAELARLAERDGISTLTRSSAVPNDVELAALTQSDAPDCLAATVGSDARGSVVLDLVRDGPHAIVGGTTGSGKSELLVTWVLAMAAERSPKTVAFLFVDFKGGAAFDPLTQLPHCVGVITDLDEDHSLRALVSLAAELRRRERTLAERGLRSIDDAPGDPPFPRLVVVVDEYAALVETHSSLHSVFADIAARGRSLGLHLVLCTQRPAGVVRDSILANCPLRISLRVLTTADSVAVIGSDDAAHLASAPPGRALVGSVGSIPVVVQVALARQTDRDRVVERWAASETPRAPWLPPLPSLIDIDRVAGSVPSDGIPFALEDRPDLQSQEPARFAPEAHGSLLVVGAGGSGKSGVLAALAAAPSTMTVELLPRELPQLWDALLAVIAAPVGPGRLLLIDDLDIAISAADEAYQPAVVELLAQLLREGRASGTHLAMTVQRISGPLQSLVSLCGVSLVLRMPSRQEHVLAGGVASDFRDELSPGAGFWRGHRVQVFHAPAPVVDALKPEAIEPELATSVCGVVSTRPGQFAERLRGLAPSRGVVVLGPNRFDLRQDGVRPNDVVGSELPVADPEDWQSQWSRFVGLQRSGDLLFDGCSLADLRTLTRSRELPPPFPRGERPLWLLRRDGGFARARLPEQILHS